MFFSLPLVPYSIMIWGNNFIDRYFILHFLDINMVSIYAVSYSLSAIVGIFYSILGFTLYPHIAKLWNIGDKTAVAEILSKGNEYFLFFAIPFVAILTILNGPIIKLFSTAEYLSGWQVIFWLSSGIVMFGLYQLNIYIILLADKTILNMIMAALSLLTNVILNIILIPKLGILGAAFSTFLTNSILAFWTITAGKKFLAYTFQWRSIAKITGATVLMSLPIAATVQYIDISNFYLLSIIICLAGAMYVAFDLISKNSLLISLRKNL